MGIILKMFEVCLHNSVHADTIGRLVDSLKESESCVVTLVCEDQKVVTINKIFVELFVKNISKILKNVENQDVIISVPLDSRVIENVFELVSKGSVYIDSDDAIERIKEGLELLGVDIEHDKLTHNKKPPRQVGNKVRRHNGVSKDTLLKIKEENKKRLKMILDEMNQDSNKKKENTPQTLTDYSKEDIEEGRKEELTEIVVAMDIDVDDQEKNEYFLNSIPESEIERKRLSKCSWCNHKTQIRKLTAHIKEVHKDKKLENCSQCDYETHDNWRLKKHIKTTHELEYRTCPYCKNDYKYLENHIKGKGCSAKL